MRKGFDSIETLRQYEKELLSGKYDYMEGEMPVDKDEEKIVLNYLDENEFEIYNERLDSDGLNVKTQYVIRNDIPVPEYFYGYNISRKCVEEEVLCKLVIFSEVSKMDTITPNKLYAKGKNKLITSGWYTSWKGKFISSSLSDRFSYSKKVREITGVSKLLTNPATSIMLSYQNIVSKNLEIENAGWNILQKLVAAYDSKKNQVELSEEEVDTLSGYIFRKCIYGTNFVFNEKQKMYLLDGYESPILKLDDGIDIKNLQVRIKQIYESEEQNLTYSENEEVANISSDDRHMHLKMYLAPIVAALCDSKDDVPFFPEMDLYKSLKWSDVPMLQSESILDKDRSEISLAYAEIQRIIDYKNTEKMTDADEIYRKYMRFYIQLLNKIQMRSNHVRPERRFCQYYVCENILGRQLILYQTAIIFDQYINKYSQMEVSDFVNQHSCLKKILRTILQSAGTLYKRNVAGEAINEYFNVFEKYKNSPNEYRRRVDGIVKDIIKSSGNFNKYEDLSIDELLCRYKGKIELSKERSKYNMDDVFAEYIRDTKVLHTKVQAGECASKTQIKAIVKKKIDEDEQNAERLAIEKWVVSSCLFEENKIDFELKP